MLADIGAAQVPQLLVFNKLDALAPAQRPAALQDVYERAGQPVERIFVSARTGEGLDLLRTQLARTVLAAGAADREGPESPDAAGEYP